MRNTWCMVIMADSQPILSSLPFLFFGSVLPSFDPIKIKIYLRCLATHAYDLTLFSPSLRRELFMISDNIPKPIFKAMCLLLVT